MGPLISGETCRLKPPNVAVSVGVSAIRNCSAQKGGGLYALEVRQGGVLKGGYSRGGCNWGTLRIPREDWGTLREH